MSYNMTRSFEDWGNSSLALRFPLFPILEDEHFCTEDCDCDADHQDFRFESFEKRTTAKYFDGYESRDIGEKYDSLIGSDVKQKTSDLIEKYIESDDDDEDTYVSLVQDDIRCGHSSTRYFESYQHSDEYKSILFGDNLEDHLTSTYFDASDEVDGFEDKSHQNQYTGDLREVETNQSFSDVVQIKSKCDRNDFGQGEKDKSHCNLTNDATVSDGVPLPAFSYDAVDCKTLGYFDVVEEYAAARSTDVQKESDASGDGDVPSQADELNNDADDEEEDDIVTLAKSVRQVLKAHVTHLQHKAMNLSSNQNVIDTLNEFRPSFIGGRNEMAIEAMQLLSQASHTDLAFEWSMLCQDCTECWTHTDLQLAAELGKTLLERNKALENSIKQQQAIIEDQTQEIEYLTKQTAVLRDVNDSRLKIYEQLEVSISELEIANKKLSEENTADKAMIKMLCGTIERLENRCDDLQRLMEETKSQQSVQRRRRRRSSRSKEEMKETDLEDHRSLHRQDARTSEEQDTDSPPYSGNSSHYGAKSSSAKVVDPFFHHHHQISQSSSTSSTTSSSPISSSGYSSSSVDSHLQRLSADSDSEPASLNSKDNPKETEDTTLTNCDEKGNESESSSDHHRQSYEFLKLECMESRERMSEMDRVLASLQSENERLRFERDQLKDQSPTDSLRSVDAEVQDVTCVRSGRLCRKCLGLMDATPANLISSAFGLMADTLQAEVPFHDSMMTSENSWLRITPESLTFGSDQHLSLQEELKLSNDFFHEQRLSFDANQLDLSYTGQKFDDNEGFLFTTNNGQDLVEATVENNKDEKATLPLETPTEKKSNSLEPPIQTEQFKMEANRPKEFIEDTMQVTFNLKERSPIVNFSIKSHRKNVENSTNSSKSFPSNLYIQESQTLKTSSTRHNLDSGPMSLLFHNSNDFEADSSKKIDDDNSQAKLDSINFESTSEPMETLQSGDFNQNCTKTIKESSCHFEPQSTQIDAESNQTNAVMHSNEKQANSVHSTASQDLLEESMSKSDCPVTSDYREIFRALFLLLQKAHDT